MDYDRLRRGLDGNDAGGDPRLGRYEIEREIGRGGMAVVYQAHDPELGRRVAIKVLSEGADERLRQEASMAARLRHPNIVAVHELGPGYIVMDLVEGRTLDEAAPTMDLVARVRAVETVARAVAHAHEQGVVHRDITPRNILISSQGDVMLTDFGLAKLLGTSKLTMTAAVLGTPHYMAPEQILGRGVGPAADVWALGVVLYELVSGHRPFDGATLGEVHDRVLHDRPAPLRGALGAVAMRALERRPERRYANVTAFAEDLGRWLGGRRLLRARLRAWAGARRPTLAVTAGLVLASTAIAWASYWRHGAQAEAMPAEALLDRATIHLQRAHSRLYSPNITIAEMDAAEGAFRQAIAQMPIGNREGFVAELASLRMEHASYALDRRGEFRLACQDGPEDAPGAPQSLRIRRARAIRMLCCARSLGRDTPERRRQLEAALQLLTGPDADLQMRGLVLAFLGRFDAADADHKEALRTIPLAWWNRAEAHALAGDLGGAEEFVARGAELVPPTPFGLVIRGRIHLAGGRFPEAISDFERAIQLDPGFSAAVREQIQLAKRGQAVPYAQLCDPQ